MALGVQAFNLDHFTVDLRERQIYFIHAGRYQLNRLFIEEPNVTLIGIGNVTLVKHRDDDGVYVREEGVGFRMLNIKIVDNVDNNDNLPANGELINADNADNKGSCLVVKANNTLIEYCYFDRRNCNAHEYAVYYPGPDHRPTPSPGEPAPNPGEPALQEDQNLPTALEIHFNDGLHTGNVFRNNRIRSRISCDNLSFSLQQNGMVENNNIEGMIAVYMCRDVTVSRNYIQGISDGRPLFITLPAQDITIDGNEMITAGDSHLIKIAKPVPGENDGDWGEFEQRINEQIHIIIKGSRYVTANDMLIDIDYPFLKEVPERPRIVAKFGHAHWLLVNTSTNDTL